MCINGKISCHLLRSVNRVTVWTLLLLLLKYFTVRPTYLNRPMRPERSLNHLLHLFFDFLTPASFHPPSGDPCRSKFHMNHMLILTQLAVHSTTTTFFFFFFNTEPITAVALSPSPVIVGLWEKRREEEKRSRLMKVHFTGGSDLIPLLHFVSL